MKRDEQGAFEVAIAVGIAGLIFIVLGGLAVVQDLNDAKSGSRGWRPGNAPAVEAPIDLFVGPAPADPGKKCIEEKMAARGYTFGAQGWRRASFPPPPPNPDRRVYRGQVTAWKGPFEKIVNEDLAEIRPVCQAPEKPIEKPKPQVFVQGRYRIQIPENQTCSGPAGKLQTQMTAATASGDGGGFTFNVSNVGPLNGTLSPEQRFDVNGSGNLAPGVTVRMAGQFVPFGDTMLIRSGELTITTPGETCRTSFDGERERP